MRLLVAVLLLVTACGVGVPDDGANPDPVIPQDPLAAEMSATVERSLPFLAARGTAWIGERGCVSCHAVAGMVWSHALARRRGLAIDEARLADWTRWSVAETAASRTDVGTLGNPDGAYQLLLARDPDVSGVLARMYQSLADEVLKTQRDDGSWPPGGQLPRQRRPAIEIEVSSTMTALLALRSMGRSGDAISRGLASLEAWKGSSDPIQSAEALLLRVLVERELGVDSEYRAQLETLLARQQADGGWSWLAGESSDAFATGQVLYALSVTGADETVIQRAWQFLRDTQQPDGSWLVASTKVNWTGPQPTSIQWGTGWAAIGILSTLPSDQ